MTAATSARPSPGVAFAASAEAAWSSVQGQLPGRDWMTPVRSEALSRVVRDGMPGRRQEWWKYADLAAMRAVLPAVVKAGTVSLPKPAWLDQQHALEAEIGQGMVVRLPAAERLPDAVEVMRLSDALAVPSLWLRPWLSPSQSFVDNLNLAFAADGLLVRVGREAVMSAPLIVHSHSRLTGAMAHDRGVVVLEDGARLTLVEVIDHAGTDGSLATSRLNIALGEGAELVHLRLARTGAGLVRLQDDRVELAKGARYQLVTLATGGQLHRSQIEVVIAGEDASSEIAAAFAARNGEVLDLSVEIDHQAPGARSRLLSRGTASRGGRGVVQGRVKVEQAAQRTDSHQLARGLLHGEGGEIFHRPELEIYADDVKCGHGAATGALDANQMFYLQSRGIEEAEARRMLLAAFFAQVIETVPASLAGPAAHWLEANLLGEGGLS